MESLLLSFLPVSLAELIELSRGELPEIALWNSKTLDGEAPALVEVLVDSVAAIMSDSVWISFIRAFAVSCIRVAA